MTTTQSGFEDYANMLTADQQAEMASEHANWDALEGPVFHNPIEERESKVALAITAVRIAAPRLVKIIYPR